MYPKNPPQRNTVAPIVLFLMGSLLGCDYMAQRPVISDGSDRPKREFLAPQSLAEDNNLAESVNAEAEEAGEIVDSEREFWDSYYIGNEHVGFSHTSVKPFGLDSISYTVEDQLSIKRGGQLINQWLKQTSLESNSGQLHEFDTEVSVGGTVTFTHGEVNYQNLEITSRRGIDKKEDKISWNKKYRGLFAVQQSLRTRPMQPGEERKIQCLLPIQYVVATISLKALDYLNVSMLRDETKKLLEIESTVSIKDRTLMKSILWTDAQGDTLKTYVPGVDLATYRTSKDLATKTVSPKSDLISATAIEISGKAPWPSNATEEISLHITHNSLDPAELIPTNPAQTVTAINGRSVKLTCRMPRNHSSDNSKPTVADLASNRLIQSDNGAVINIVKSMLLPKDLPAVEKMELLRRTAYKHIDKKDFSKGFLSAAEVAINATGDCTEHAVLLAALCRAEGIASRVAAGLLRLQPPESGEPILAYHMWTLAWTGDQWRALDATLPDTIDQIDRITLLTSDLADGNEYSCLLPVLQVIGQLKIEVVE